MDDLDKAEHGLHILLTRGAGATSPPLGTLAEGGAEIPGQEVGYGSARACVGSALALLLTAAPLHAQEVVLLPSSATRVFPAEFTSIRAVRELSDGCALVVDSREYRLLVLDWERGTLRAILRSGDGPGEFRSLSTLAAVRGRDERRHPRASADGSWCR